MYCIYMRVRVCVGVLKAYAVQVVSTTIPSLEGAAQSTNAIQQVCLSTPQHLSSGHYCCLATKKISLHNVAS